VVLPAAGVDGDAEVADADIVDGDGGCNNRRGAEFATVDIDALGEAEADAYLGCEAAAVAAVAEAGVNETAGDRFLRLRMLSLKLVFTFESTGTSRGGA
jgi:hypothetical protein